MTTPRDLLSKSRQSTRRLRPWMANYPGWVVPFVVGFWVLAGMAACTASNQPNPTNAVGPKPLELTLVSYAVTEAAYAKIIPQFTQQWQQEHNQRVTINQSYGGSGAQARAVIDGLDADVVALSLAPDVDKMAKKGLIKPGWETRAPNHAIVAKSVVALVTRPNNPKGINSWSDLVKDDVQVITANPKTSGGARWNFMALWGSVTQTGGTTAAATNFVTQVYQHTPILPEDSRQATGAFYRQGQGDVLIDYENEVLLAKRRGNSQPYLVPEVNISVDNPVAVVDANVDKHGTREVAEAFVKFLFTPFAQREFAKAGFRPSDPGVAKEFSRQFPQVTKLFTVQDLGGWDVVQKEFFADGALFDQIQSKLGQ